jgi:hypothetical protein
MFEVSTTGHKPKKSVGEDRVEGMYWHIQDEYTTCIMGIIITHQN